MSANYLTTIKVTLPADRATVFTAMCDTSRYPLWNSGMKHISVTKPLEKGMQYQTETILAGHVIQAYVEITRLIPNEAIEFTSESGALSYKALFTFQDIDGGHTQVSCTLQFQFRSFVIDLARPVIESMAQTRVRGNLESLAVLIAQGGPAPV